MNPSTLLLIVAALACPIGMGIMMWMMNRNMGGQPGKLAPGPTSPPSQRERLQTLREQRQLLELEITEAEKIVALQARKDSATNGPGSVGQISSAAEPLTMTGKK